MHIFKKNVKRYAKVFHNINIEGDIKPSSKQSIRIHIINKNAPSLTSIK